MTMSNGSPGLSRDAREGLYATGHALFTQERYADAAAIFRIMLRLAPGDERSWLALGECHERAGHDELALELYSAGYTVVPHAARCALARFRILSDCGRSEEADLAFEQSLEIAERNDDEDFMRLLESERRLRP
jgi:Flp pilus assembly protein TadD